MNFPITAIIAISLIANTTIQHIKTTIKPQQHITKKIKPAAKLTKKVTTKMYRGVVTTYSRKFEGRLMASGKRFSHSKHYVASRCFKFGTKIRIFYGRRYSDVEVMDRGSLPLHKPNRVQFDLPQKVAKELGLYKVVKGKTDRTIHYKILK